MSRYYLKAQRFNKKIRNILLKNEIIKKSSSKVITQVFSTYCQILMISEKKKSFKKLKQSNEYKKMLKNFKDCSTKTLKTLIKPSYDFIQSKDVIIVSSLLNNKNIVNIFIKTFWYKNSKKNIDIILSSLLNDIVYLYVVAGNHKKNKNYKLIKEKDIKNFTNILEINKNFQNKVQMLFPRQCNHLIVFVNSLLNI